MKQQLSARELANDYARIAKRERAAEANAFEKGLRFKVEMAKEAAERAEAVEAHLRRLADIEENLDVTQPTHAARWRAIEPFLEVERDGDSEGSWVNLGILDKDTGDACLELFPAADTTTVAAFVDRLIQEPQSRVGYRSEAQHA